MFVKMLRTRSGATYAFSMADDQNEPIRVSTFHSSAGDIRSIPMRSMEINDDYSMYIVFMDGSDRLTTPIVASEAIKIKG